MSSERAIPTSTCNAPAGYKSLLGCRGFPCRKGLSFEPFHPFTFAEIFFAYTNSEKKSRVLSDKKGLTTKIFIVKKACIYFINMVLCKTNKKKHSFILVKN
jgi:hypothetical protein